jgi:uncharacterized membrane protein YgcG
VFELARKTDDDGALSPEERAAAAALFPAGAVQIRIAPSDGARIAAAKDALANALRAEHGEQYFRLNRQWAVPGVLLSVALVVYLIAMLGGGEARVLAAIMAFLAMVWPAGIFVATRATVEIWRRVRRARFPLGRTLGALLSTIVGLGIVWGMGLGFAAFVAYATTIGAALLVVASGIVDGLLFWLLPRPTARGRALLDEIEGFRAYLTGVGGAGWLPYAMALGVDAAGGSVGYSLVAVSAPAACPRWYSDDFTNDRPASSVYPAAGAPFDGAAVAHALSSAVSSSSSSGSSGGSSGSGGGGGGGGGW